MPRPAQPQHAEETAHPPLPSRGMPRRVPNAGPTAEPSGIDNQSAQRQAREADQQAVPVREQAPAEIPWDSPPETVELARTTAERIDDTVTRGWGRAAGGRQSQAIGLASQIERILADTFEAGHSLGPQLRDDDAPLLQYFVAQHPGLRERLTVLRHNAGAMHTQRIGKYLDIPLLTTRGFEYEIQMLGASGGELVEGAVGLVSIRYLEDGQIRWRRPYHYEAGGGGGGLAPWNMSADIGWNRFYTFEYWSPDDFIGPIGITGASVAVGIGYEIEGATFYGNGLHVPVDADIGGWIFSTADLGASAFMGRLSLAPNSPPAPPPNRGILPPPPPFVERPEVRANFVLGFATDQSALDETAQQTLAVFVQSHHPVFAEGDYALTLIGQASRTGGQAYNQRLSEQRVASVRAAIEQLLRAPLDSAHLTEAAIGEDLAEREGRSEKDNSADYRSVEVILVGRYTRPLPPPQ